jgi:alanine dehydrogenase
LTETLLLSRADVAELLTIEECISVVEKAFALYGSGSAPTPGILGIHVKEGGFHIKAGVLDLNRNYFVAKINANFPGNPLKHSLPTIQGIVAVFDATDGQLLALMDSIQLTILRTGAATAVAAKYLSREDSRTATIFGCGNQGKISLLSLVKVRALEKVFAYDLDKDQAMNFAGEMSAILNIPVMQTDNPGLSASQSDICITCTPSKKPFLKSADIRPGTFIAAVGSDSEEKQELYPELLLSNKVVADILVQCKSIGEIHHSLESGSVDIHAELGEVVAGRKPGRETQEEIIIFDSTGMALQDVAAAAIVYEKAVNGSDVRKMNFGK